MRKTLWLIFWISLGTGFQLVAQQSTVRNRFAGLHLDFHAGKNDTLIGKTFTFALIDSMLTVTQPDFIQVDCKGHDGFSSYPTKTGNAPTRFEKDIMKIWREVTRKHGIPLYVHYSGVWDSEAIRQHPEWARINADGSRDKNAVSLLSPYADELLIPQLKELAVEYQLDGAWIDGECWVMQNDYSPDVMERFTRETGIEIIPRKNTDPHFFEWSEFNRKLFREYVTHYVNAVHAVRPDFKITSNWAFSSMMPEPVDVPVDYLSGDVAGTNGLYSSAFESRCLALQGKSWDLMSWSFTWKADQLKATKSVQQLQQEAAQVLAMGGGFQSYWQQNRDGTPEPYHFGAMGELLRFTKARREYTYENEIIPQVGLLYSNYAWKRIPAGGLYQGHSQAAVKGTLNMLLDRQMAVDIIQDHQLTDRLQKYPVVVLPEWTGIDPEIRTQLLQYVENGGNLLITGAAAISGFQEELGIKTAGNMQKDSLFFAGAGKKILRMKTSFQPVHLLEGTQPFGWQYTSDDLRFRGEFPLASVRKYGKGRIAGLYLNTGDYYTKNKNSLIPELLETLIRYQTPNLITSVKGSSKVHQVVARKNNKLTVHLINTGGAHDNPTVATYDEVTPLHDLELNVRLFVRPKTVRLQPGNRSLPFQYQNGNVTIKIPVLDIYRIVEIEDIY